LKKGRCNSGRSAIRTAKAGSDYTVSGLPEGTIRMDLNTNLLGPNPAVDRLIRSGRWETHQYPSPHAEALRAALGKEWGISPDSIICANGVDDIINICIKAFTDRGDTIAYPVPSFTMYNFWTLSYGCVPLEVPLGPGFEVDIDALLARPSKLIIVASPHSPTGHSMPEADIVRLIESTKGTVALDEAYIEYSSGSFIGRIGDYQNLVVMRTFSKAYALAGLRVGMAASVGGIGKLKAVKAPFNLNVISEAAAIAALKNRKWLQKGVAIIKKERPLLGKALHGLGFRVYPSETNFLLCVSPVPSGELCEELVKRAVLIKDFGNVPGFKDHVRITVGAPTHNRILVERLKDILGGRMGK